MTEPPDVANYCQDSIDEPFDHDRYAAAVRAYEATPAPGGFDHVLPAPEKPHLYRDCHGR